MNFRIFIFFILVTGLSCTGPSPKTKPVQNRQENKYDPNNKPPSSFSDTVGINSSAAVFYSPDSVQLEKIRSVMDSGAFEANMHEFFFLMRNARLVIKKNRPQLNIIEAKNLRYLLFSKTDKTTECLDLDKKPDAYGLFIFDGQKSPQLVDMSNIDTQLGFYFSK